MSIFMYKDEKIINPIEKNLIGLTDISSIGDGTITGAINTLNSLDVNTEAGAHGLRIHNDLLQYNNGLEWKNIEANGVLSVQLNAPSNVTVKAGNAKVTLKWTDPEDVTIASGTLARWVETVIVRKENIAPANENDGVVVLRSTTRNQYSSEGYVDNNVTNGVVYYYGIFPKTNSGVYTYSCTKKALDIDIVTWADGTDAQISAMLEAHYAGDMDISDYWNIGDVRTVSISSFSSGTVTHVAQNIQLVIIGIKHDDLTTSINGKTKAAITVQTKQMLGNTGSAEREYYWGSSHYPVSNSENWSDNPLRTTYLNTNFYNALSTTTFRNLIKTVTKKNLSTHTGTTTINTSDKIFLPSYPEVFGTTVYSNYISGGAVSNYEGTQYNYFSTSSNRIKYWNNNGANSSTAGAWWLRSPSSYYNSSYGYYWCYVYSGGTATCGNGSDACGLAPCFTI